MLSSLLLLTDHNLLLISGMPIRLLDKQESWQNWNKTSCSRKEYHTELLVETQ
jgi:hypothetical protein